MAVVVAEQAVNHRLGGGFLYWAVALLRNRNPRAPMEMFRYSLWYLLILFVALLVDHYYLLAWVPAEAGGLQAPVQMTPL